MRILIVSPTPSQPSNAGNRLRVQLLCEQLKNRGEDVHFLYYSLEGEPSAEMRTYWGEKLFVVETKGLIGRAIRNKIKQVFWGLGLKGLLPESIYTYSIDSWYNDEVSRMAAQLQQVHNFDVVIAEYAFMSKVLAVFPTQVRKVIDTHDRLGERYQMFLNAGMMPDWFSCSVAEEQKGLNRADQVIAIQYKEAQYFRSICSKSVNTIGIALPFTEVELKTPLSLGFFASSNAINVDALNLLQDEIWPLVLQAVPTAKLVLAGNICDFATDQPGLVKLGRVKHQKDAYAHMQVVINPMRLGTGLKIKSIEAIAHGRKLVAHEHAAEGLEAGEVILTGTTAEQLSKHIISIFAANEDWQVTTRQCQVFIDKYRQEQEDAISRVLSL